MALKNEIGNKYGKLTVIEKSDKTDSSKNIYWVCKCECGQITVAKGSKLRNGTRVSCGCQRKEKLSQIAKSKPVIDEKGNTYGRLKVIDLSYIDEKSNRYWNCICECGNKVVVRGSELRNGHTQSCGCLSSKGEYLITQFLINNHIDFEKQKTFQDCRFQDTNALARFDFYLPKYNLCIEYDGIQHFQLGGWVTEEKFKKIQEHDKYKNEYCKQNNIQLIRISYRDNLEKRLNTLLLSL